MNDSFNPGGLRVAVAPDKFKGTMSATEVCREISSAVMRWCPGAEVRECPMADGGEGTAEIVGDALGLGRSEGVFRDAILRRCQVVWRGSATTAAVDSASVVGLAMLAGEKLAPFGSTSYGLGELLMSLVGKGIRRIYVGIGGTATVDGGAGMLQALGVRFFAKDGRIIEQPVTAAMLEDIAGADLSGVPEGVASAVVGLADVALPLLPAGGGQLSSLSFARQKGVGEDSIAGLASGLANLRRVLASAGGCKGDSRFSGAGGGIGFALGEVLECRMEAGAPVVMEMQGVFGASGSRQPSVVITGEGCFDEQSMAGKVVGTVYGRARQLGVPVVVVAGRSTFDSSSAGFEGRFPGLTLVEAATPLPLSHGRAVVALRDALERFCRSGFFGQ